MRSGFRKIGLALSAAAILFTALFLPCHHHEEKARDCSPSHCSVCHFSKEAKAAAAVPSVSGSVMLVEEAIFPVLDSHVLALFPGRIPQRGPPAV